MFAGTKISGKKAKKLVSKGAVLIDVRDPVSFRDGSLPGAINLSLRQIINVRAYPITTSIVIFGATSNDPTLSSALSYIEQFGYTKLFTIGGIDEWNK